MSSPFSQFSDMLADTVTNAGSSVVRVDARRRLPASGIVWSTDGIIITAHHVVRSDESITIGLPGGESIPATLIGRDPTTDLAILRADAEGLAPMKQMNPDELKVGSAALALGRPGRSVQATFGIVSALSGGWRTRAGGQVDSYLQHDAIMYPGFSGGPLVSANGYLLGMNTSALVQGIGLALPTATLERISVSLLEHGRVRRGYLGITSQRVQLPGEIASEIGQKRGLLIITVESGSPAEAAGLTMGDTIVTLAGSPVHSHEALLTVLTGDRVGQAVAVKFVRGGKLEQLDVTVGERE